MHMTRAQALQYLKDVGYPTSQAALYRWRRWAKATMQERLYELAQYEWPEQHLEAIEELKAGRRKMWENIQKIHDPFKQNLAIQNLLNLLPLTSEYYAATKGVIEKPVESKEDIVIQESTTESDQWV